MLYLIAFLNLTRCYGIDADLRRKLQGQALGQVDDGGLGQTIDGVNPDERGDGREVDNASPSALLHTGGQRLGQEVARLDVAVQHCIPHVFGQVEKGNVGVRPDVVHQDVDTSEARKDLRGKPTDLAG